MTVPHPPPRDAESAGTPREAGKPPHAPHRRYVLLIVGWVFFALGAAGTVLPLLPATPLLLVALWAFSASSERFHRWLWNHRTFGPVLQAWKRDRVIPLRAKIVAVASMAASLLYVGLVRRSPVWVLAVMAALMIPGLVFLTRFPSRRLEPRDGTEP